MITTVLRVFIYGLFVRADLPILLIVMFGSLFIVVFYVFGSVQSVVVSCAGVVVPAAAGFRAAPLTPALWLCFRRVLLCGVFLVIATIIFSGARIAVFGMSDLERRRGSWRLGCLSGGLSSTGSSLSSLLVSLGVSTMYTL